MNRRSFSSLLLAATCFAQPVWAQGFGSFPRVAQILNAVAIAHPPGDAARLFILTLQGQIVIVENQTTQRTTPFLNFASLVGEGNGSTGLVFDPDYASNGYFYVCYTTRSMPSIPMGLVIARYRVSPDDPNIADPATRAVVLMIPSPGLGQHSGGWMDFGQDGLLYITGGDQLGSAPRSPQDAASLTGKILRIDVRTDAFPDDPNRFYAIPPTNPYAGATAGADEVWALGIRNAFRGSFDRATGDLWFGDVGQSSFEEINFHRAGTPAGLNFGWPCREGFNAASGGTGCLPNPPLFTSPVIALNRGEGAAIIGGYIYRGCANPDMRGRYVFGDQVTRRVYSFDPSAPRGTLINHTLQFGLPTSPFGFGEDADGELFMCGFSGVFKLLPPVGTLIDCNGNGITDACDIARGTEPDLDNDGVPDSCTLRCPPDINGNGIVNLADLYTFIDQWFANAPRGDFNRDTRFSPQDVFDYLGAYFAGCP